MCAWHSLQGDECLEVLPKRADVCVFELFDSQAKPRRASAADPSAQPNADRTGGRCAAHCRPRALQWFPLRVRSLVVMQFLGEAVLPVITDCLTRILSPSCRMVPQSGTIRGVLIDSIAIGAFDQPFLRGAPMPINVRILHRRSAADGPALRRYDSVL